MSEQISTTGQPFTSKDEHQDPIVSNAVQFIHHQVGLHFRETPTDSNSQSSVPPRPLFVGLQGAQGIGKSTAVASIAKRLRSEPFNLNVITMSLDDFYLTHEEQNALEGRYPENSLLRGRGPPGTHDIKLATAVFNVLEDINSHSNKSVCIPRYDKSAFGGKGDRSHVETIELASTLHLVILEGWMVGFQSRPERDFVNQYSETLSLALGRAMWSHPTIKLPPAPKTYITGHKCQDLVQVNELLQPYQKNIWSKLDLLIKVIPKDYDWVYKWRLEQEHQMKASNGGLGMSDCQVHKFIDRYMPFYEFYKKRVTIRPNPPSPLNGMRIFVNESRVPVEISPFSIDEEAKRYDLPMATCYDF
ncbi:P-loop containing nucleoside triphosphate hydrolase protein [Melampsora americana]|nr:P-loop containing nucleoside triphosphate hydrolase protein [Melampsora americana]